MLLIPDSFLYVIARTTRNVVTFLTVFHTLLLVQHVMLLAVIDTGDEV